MFQLNYLLERYYVLNYLDVNKTEEPVNKALHALHQYLCDSHQSACMEGGRPVHSLVIRSDVALYVCKLPEWRLGFEAV